MAAEKPAGGSPPQAREPTACGRSKLAKIPFRRSVPTFLHLRKLRNPRLCCPQTDCRHPDGERRDRVFSGTHKSPEGPDDVRCLESAHRRHPLRFAKRYGVAFSTDRQSVEKCYWQSGLPRQPPARLKSQPSCSQVRKCCRNR